MKYDLMFINYQIQITFLQNARMERKYCDNKMRAKDEVNVCLKATYWVILGLGRIKKKRVFLCKFGPTFFKASLKIYIGAPRFVKVGYYPNDFFLKRDIESIIECQHSQLERSILGMMFAMKL